jgi:hypothetical protein
MRLVLPARRSCIVAALLQLLLMMIAIIFIKVAVMTIIDCGIVAIAVVIITIMTIMIGIRISGGNRGNQIYDPPPRRGPLQIHRRATSILVSKRTLFARKVKGRLG